MAAAEIPGIKCSRARREARDIWESTPMTPATCRCLTRVASQGCSDRRLAVCSRTGLSQVMDPREEKVKSRADRNLDAITWNGRAAYRKAAKAIIMSKIFLPGGKTDFAPAESLPDCLRRKDLCWMYWQLEELFPLGHSGKTAKKMFFNELVHRRLKR